jgi:hypothetical protein
MNEPRHIESDDARDIQHAIHDIAQKWIARGFCSECVVSQIIMGASVVAQDAVSWPATAVHEVVDDAFDTTDTKHVRSDH